MSNRNKAVMITFGLLFLINAVNLNNAECAIFGANQSIASGSNAEQNPAIAVDINGNIFIVWEISPFDTSFNISSSYSNDNGKTFNVFVPGIGDSSTNNIERFPAITANDQGTVYITWTDSRDSTFGFSTFGNMIYQFGDRWSLDYEVSDDASSPFTETHPSMVVGRINNSDHIYVVWEDDRNGDHDIWMDQSTDGSFSFFSASTDIRVDDTDRNTTTTDNASDQTHPEIAMRMINQYTVPEVFVVWQDTRNQTGTRFSDVYFTKGTDDDGDGKIEATEFDTDVRVNESLSTSGIYYTAEQPDIAVDNSGNAYVVWRDNRNGTNNYDIYFTRKVSTATSFGTNYKVNDDTGTADQSSPAIAVDKLTGYIYVVWADERDGNKNIYYSTSTDGGITWSRNVRVDTQDTAGTDSAGTQDSPDIALDSNRNVYIVWDDSRNGTYDIYFAKQLSQDDGTSPQAPAGLTTTSSPTKVDLSWNANTEADLSGYNLLRSTTSGGPYVKINGDPIEILTYSDSGLVGTYYYVLEAIDIAGNTSPFSSEVTANPTFESPGSGGGGCFIATAAFGSPLSEEVQILSQMRDRYLLQSAIGRRLVGFYYKKGPAIADYISDKEYVKGIVRAMLKPLVKVCQKVL